MLNIICDTIAQYDCRLRDYRQHKGLQNCLIRLKERLKLIKCGMFESYYYLHFLLVTLPVTVKKTKKCFLLITSIQLSHLIGTVYLIQKISI